ncbi:hypothetical protein AMJ85_02140 [candidate division BRC1 bacterium SM23_51]|nr:MAG: hypothetical protein AMJ85_02140 [candidate division BRC1 bacterium SM23_51]
MKRTTTTTVVVGIFFVVGILLLIWFSLRVQGTTARAKTDTYYAEFDEVAGLQEGAPVTLAGVEVGSVSALRYDGQRGKVIAELAVIREHKIRRSDQVGIETRSFLGQYFINIAPGDLSAPFVPPDDPGEILPTYFVPDLSDLMAVVTGRGEGGGLVQSLDTSVTSLSQQILDVIAENRENLRRTTEAFAETAPKIEALASSVSVAVAAFAEIAEALSTGEGTLGRLLRDETLYYRVSDTAENLQAITQKMRDGEGLAGRLVNDDQMSSEVEQMVVSFRAAADEVRTVLEANRPDIEKTLGSLGKMGDDLGRAADNLVAITDKIRTSEGTLGLLINDKTLYDDVRNTIDQVRRTFEQTEEQSVIRTFLGIVFGAAQ